VPAQQFEPLRRVERCTTPELTGPPVGRVQHQAELTRDHSAKA